ANRLADRYDANSKLDFRPGTRAIIPLNRHRWELSIHAMLAFSKNVGRPLTIFISGHEWTSRVPTNEERTAALLLGDEAKLTIPGVFPYVEGMPVVVNVNKYMGLKVVNGAEFEAVGIITEPGTEEILLDDHIRLCIGPPAGILLRSEATKDLALPHIPPDTVLLPRDKVTLEEKHAKTLCPELLRRKGFKLGVTRTGLPCTPGLTITDFKAQGRSMDETLLGLYGRRCNRQPGGTAERLAVCDIISMYVQLSRARSFDGIRLVRPLDKAAFLAARMPEELTRGIERLDRLAEMTVAAYEARTHQHDGPGSSNIS
ncbi:DNA repair and recombination protein, partial [Colletotrichum plurivorum]